MSFCEKLMVDSRIPVENVKLAEISLLIFIREHWLPKKQVKEV